MQTSNNSQFNDYSTDRIGQNNSTTKPIGDHDHDRTGYTGGDKPFAQTGFQETNVGSDRQLNQPGFNQSSTQGGTFSHSGFNDTLGQSNMEGSKGFTNPGAERINYGREVDESLNGAPGTGSYESTTIGGGGNQPSSGGIGAGVEDNYGQRAVGIGGGPDDRYGKQGVNPEGGINGGSPEHRSETSQFGGTNGTGSYESTTVGGPGAGTAGEGIDDGSREHYGQRTGGIDNNSDNRHAGGIDFGSTPRRNGNGNISNEYGSAQTKPPHTGPSITDKIKGKVEKTAGKVAGNETMIQRGEERQSGASYGYN